MRHRLTERDTDWKRDWLRENNTDWHRERLIDWEIETDWEIKTDWEIGTDCAIDWYRDWLRKTDRDRDRLTEIAWEWTLTERERHWLTERTTERLRLRERGSLRVRVTQGKKKWLRETLTDRENNWDSGWERGDHWEWLNERDWQIETNWKKYGLRECDWLS